MSYLILLKDMIGKRERQWIAGVDNSIQNLEEKQIGIYCWQIWREKHVTEKNKTEFVEWVGGKATIV